MKHAREHVGPGRVRGQYWSPRTDGKVQCDLCPRACRLGPGQRGFCYVRQERDGGIDLTSYGRASGFCIDPIEKKPLNHFYPGSSVLSFGTAGCNLGCKFCQNWSISKARAHDALQDAASPEQIAMAARKAGCHSVAFTYNDPVIFAEYAIDCAHAAHEQGVRTVAVTAGYIGEVARDAFFAPLDAANIDLKAFSERFYRKLCFAELGPVLETLLYVARETDVWLEVTTLLIPGENDSDGELAQLCEWFASELGQEVPLHFTAFHPDFKLQDQQVTPAATLRRARSHAKRAGLKHVYTGNVYDPEGQSTYCTGCSEPVVERDRYRIGAYRLDRDGRCVTCETPLAGHYSSAPGDWGCQRRRLTISKSTP